MAQGFWHANTVVAFRQFSVKASVRQQTRLNASSCNQGGRRLCFRSGIYGNGEGCWIDGRVRRAQRGFRRGHALFCRKFVLRRPGEGSNALYEVAGPRVRHHHHRADFRRAHAAGCLRDPGIRVASGGTREVELPCEDDDKLASVFAAVAALCWGLGSAHGRLRSANVLGGSLQVVVGCLLDTGQLLVRVGRPFARHFPVVPATV